jgi:hypothetical protein
MAASLGREEHLFYAKAPGTSNGREMMDRRPQRPMRRVSETPAGGGFGEILGVLILAKSGVWLDAKDAAAG